MQTGEAYGGQRSITGAAQDRMCSTQVHVDTILCHKYTCTQVQEL